MGFYEMGDSLEPKFVIFHYFIRWYIETFGFTLYLISFVGSIAALLGYAIYINKSKGESDRVVMIVILSLIIVFGLIGVGFDISNGY